MNKPVPRVVDSVAKWGTEKNERWSNAGEFQKLKFQGMYLGLKKGLGNPVVLC